MESTKKVKDRALTRAKHVYLTDPSARGLAVDCRPDVDLLAVDVDLCLNASTFVSFPVVWLEQVFEPVKPRVNRLVRLFDEPINITV